MRDSLIFVFVVLLLTFVAFGCGEFPTETENSGQSTSGANDAEAGAPDWAALPGDPDDPLDSPESGNNQPDELTDTEPLGTNPALDFGPYDMETRFVKMNDDTYYETAYYFIPVKNKGEDPEGPFPTIVWGHGIYSAFMPFLQREMFKHLVSHGYLVIYPNVEVDFPVLDADTTIRGITIYLESVRMAVRQGLADRDKIIFGGYSMGARIGSLATAFTTGMDPLHIWPDPIACVFEALPDFLDGDIIDMPGPRPSDWAQFIAPEIPITLIVAEGDTTVRNYNPDTGEPENGPYFFEQLPSNFAQLIVLKDGSTVRDHTSHATFMMPSADILADAYDYWGHMKIVAGMAKYHFKGFSRQWAYGIMRKVGGWDHGGQRLTHEVYERHGGINDGEPAFDDIGGDETEGNSIDDSVE